MLGTDKGAKQAVWRQHKIIAHHSGAGSYTFTREQIGTRDISVGIRTLVNPADPEGIKQVHASRSAACALTAPRNI